jgi:hypothetical protein
VLGVDAAPVVGSEVDDIFWPGCVASAVCDSVCVIRWSQKSKAMKPRTLLQCKRSDIRIERDQLEHYSLENRAKLLKSEAGADCDR